MITKLEDKLYRVKVGIHEDELEVSGSRHRSVTVIAKTAIAAAARVRLSNAAGKFEFIDEIEFVDYVDKK